MITKETFANFWKPELAQALGHEPSAAEWETFCENIGRLFERSHYESVGTYNSELGYAITEEEYFSQ